MTIYMISESRCTGEDNSGRDIYNDFINDDFGYFTTREAAQAEINRIGAEEQAAWDEVYTEYVEKLAAANEKRDKLRESAKELGISPYTIQAPYIYRPVRSFYITDRTIVEIEPA
jgi:hypothetical protein